jgi:hypothetical protein
MAANTYKMAGNFIEITTDGTDDFDLTEFFPDHPEWINEGMKVSSITIYGATGVHAVIIRNAASLPATPTDAPAIFRHFNATASGVSVGDKVIDTKYFNGGRGAYMWPCFAASELTDGAATIMIELATE